MITRICNGKVVSGEISEQYVYFENGVITAVTPRELPFDCEVDAKGGYICAGFIDLHCHGGGGADFSDGTEEAIRVASEAHLRHGTTSLFPTLMSLGKNDLQSRLKVFKDMKNKPQNFCGVHLEGPYLSPEQCGAQKGDVLRFPEPNEYEFILSEYDIARWSYAPELDKDFAFLTALSRRGTIAAAAHTNASCKEMLAAATHGCGLITHLYSATSTITRKNGFRTAGVTEAAYLSEDICSELITDGRHLPAELILLAFKRIGSDRLALITDAMRAAGTDIKESFIGPMGSGVWCIIEDGVAKLPDRSAFAGSIATTDRLVKTCVEAGVPLAEAVKAITKTPAKIAGLKNKGSLEKNFDADIVILDAELKTQNVIVKGKKVI